MTEPTDLVCFSHLRWGYVFQRPNHLMSRAAQTRRVFFIEEPVADAPPGRHTIEMRSVDRTLTVCTPHVAPHLSDSKLIGAQRQLTEQLFRDRKIAPGVLWYYTPMALPFSRQLRAPLVVYDCMDELSAFKDAPRGLSELETELFLRADLVLTGGHSLYRSKQARHPNVHPFPSSVDAKHFGQARERRSDPPDQAPIGRPRIGYFGVIDERIDLDLIRHVAEQRPEWNWVLLGPVAKIDTASLPKLSNLHWLGRKEYTQLPDYLAGWDVATMPFALNRSTAFISPTKTLEYMAAGKPVVSTAIADVVQPYGDAGAVAIADRSSFAHAIEQALLRNSEDVRLAADRWVKLTSWDRTWSQISELMTRTLVGRNGNAGRTGRPCSTI